ncbi:MAG: NUDIX domain-containing protein [Planctomycetes bacterium]|nr:NUDIX domain-containing protein [Planctomycetota bacterium]
MEADETDLDRHPHPHLAVDVALLTLHERALHALLLRRDAAPFAGAASLPGGFVHIDESLPDAVVRVLREKCGLHGVFVEQLFTFGDVGRDPRGRVVTVAYYALVPVAALAAARATGELTLCRLDVPWPQTQGGPVRALDANGKPLRLAFDHDVILGTTVQRLRGKIDYAPVGFELLPPQFTLLDLLEVHQAVLGCPINKDSFRRRLLASGLLAPTGRLRANVAHRPAALFRFRRKGRGKGHA